VIRSAAAVVGACALLFVSWPPAGAQTADVTIRRDLTYAVHGNTTLRLDAYLPAGGGERPGVIVIYGGKWIAGDKSDHPEIPTYFAQQGFAAFAVNYRSAEHDPFPAAVEDVQAAVDWVRSHASRFGLDPERLGALGWSAGGHLAAALATFGEGPLDQGSRVMAALSWSGPTNLAPLLRASDADLRSAVSAFLGCGRGPDCEELARMASPVTHVDPSDAPLLIANSSAEIIPFDQAEVLAEVMDQEGVPYVLHEFPGRHHGLGIGGNDKGLDEAVAFFREWLDAGGAVVEEPSADATGEGESVKSSPQPDTAASPGAGAPGKTSPAAKPVAPASVERGVSTWTLLLVTVGLVALVVSGIQLRVGLQALRAARQEAPKDETNRGSELRGGDPADYDLRRTEDTRRAP
jgi:acetyl esterase